MFHQLRCCCFHLDYSCRDSYWCHVVLVSFFMLVLLFFGGGRGVILVVLMLSNLDIDWLTGFPWLPVTVGFHTRRGPTCVCCVYHRLCRAQTQTSPRECPPTSTTGIVSRGYCCCRWRHRYCDQCQQTVSVLVVTVYLQKHYDPQYLETIPHRLDSNRMLKCAVSPCLDSVVKTVSKTVGSALTPLTTVCNDRSKTELAILSHTKLPPLIICSNYDR